MLDPKLLRERPDIVINDLEKRCDTKKIKLVHDFTKIDKIYRKDLFSLQKLRHSRNSINLEIAKMRKAGKNVSFNVKEMASLATKIKKAEIKNFKLKEKLKSLQFQFPNILHESVPKGKTDLDNVILRKWGRIRDFEFKPKNHIELMRKLDIAELERAAKISGARFYFLKKELVLLDFALMKFVMDFLVKRGFTLIEPPFMMKRAPYEGVIDLVDFETVMYKIDGEDLYMIATSEHPIVAMHMGETIHTDSLPLRYAGFSSNFRKEAGSHGMDTKGIFRVHQFNKIEQLVITKPEDSWAEHRRLIKNTEAIFKALKLPYRVVDVCTGDIGTIAAKKVDLEVWMPAQKRYREVTSCSNCTDYQARRLGIKYGEPDKKPIGYVHVLNATGIATSRAIVAILENYQQADGSITIPTRLREYMGGLKKISK